MRDSNSVNLGIKDNEKYKNEALHQLKSEKPSSPTLLPERELALLNASMNHEKSMKLSAPKPPNKRGQ